MNALETVSTDDLILEIKKRYPRGILCTSREPVIPGSSGKTETLAMGWGEPMWGLGAAKFMMSKAEAEHNASQIPFPDDEPDGGS